MTAEGVTPCLHQHVGSWIETPEETEAVLAAISPDLLLFGPDTGHLAWAGADPADLIERHLDRVGAVHLKEYGAGVAGQARTDRWSYREATARHAFTEPGRGDVDFAAVLKVLSRFDGWYVVEVDIPDQPTAAVLQDQAVDIVAVCSPHAFHADQVIAACQAGKRGVLCEKPMTTTADQARQVAAAAAATGVPVIVGTMHSYDPAYRAARGHWGDLPDTATLVRSVIYLPSNDLMVAAATDSAGPPAADAAGVLPHPPNIKDAILGLAMHALPLVREFLPAAGSVSFARLLKPWGYSVTITSGDRAVQLIGFMPGRWAPDWRLSACGDGRELHVAFPPSYVLAGSATATLAADGTRQSWRYPDNGYQAEWEHVADVAEGRTQPSAGLDTAIADLLCAIDIADQAAAVDAALAGAMS
jgi:myo-inositol 2-dehydrogenase / D-chiro-inositol 1-dehydrogenase